MKLSNLKFNLLFFCFGLSASGQVVLPSPGQSETKPVVIIADKDGDGIGDKKDKCPTEKGVASNNGCPVNKLYGIKNSFSKTLFDYTGKISNGKPNGRGVAKYDDGFVYEGYFTNGEFEDKDGVLTYPYNDGYYKGGFKNSEFNGKGTRFYNKIGKTYIGLWKNHQKNDSNATYLDTNTGEKYIGLWIEDEFLKGKKFDNDGILLYEGEFKSGQYDGLGIQYFRDSTYYSGSFIKGERNGWGQVVWRNGANYTGEWIKNKRTGWGTYVFPDSAIWEGQWVNDGFTGNCNFIIRKYGFIYDLVGIRAFCGQTSNDTLNGFGRVYTTYSSKPVYLLYSNRFDNNKPTGPTYPGYTTEPSYLAKDGSGYLVLNTDYTGDYFAEFKPFEHLGSARFIGTIVKNHGLHGWGTLTFPKEDYKIEGEFKDGKITGFATMSNKDGIRYKGEWKNNYPDGFGIYYNEKVPALIINNKGEKKEGVVYIGQLEEGQKSGRGRLYDKEMRKIFEGEFKEDKPVLAINKIDE